MTIVRTTTPAGDAIVILPEAEFERLLELAEDTVDARTIAASQERLANDRDELLTEADLDALRAAPTPLAFWREKRCLPPHALARLAGIESEALAAMESGDRTGDIDAYRRLANALDIDLEDILPERDPP